MKKEKVNAVFAVAGGKAYKIPTDVAAQYEIPASESPFDLSIGDPAIKEAIDNGKINTDEVSGRDHENTDWHCRCQFGIYIWWQDGNLYSGPHAHPVKGNPLAVDIDDGFCL